jgi:hypothetical protein
MKPTNIIGIISQSIKLYRSNFKEIILFSLLFVGTVSLIITLIMQTAFIRKPIMSEQSILDIITSWLAILLIVAVAIFTLSIVIGGITFITLTVAHGNRAGRYVSNIWSRCGKLSGTLLSIVALFILLYFVFFVILNNPDGFGLLLAIPIGIIMIICFIVSISISALAFPIAIQEERYGFSLMRRALALSSSRTSNNLFITGLLVQVIAFIFSKIFGLFHQQLVSTIFHQQLVSTICKILVSCLLLPIPIIAMALLYLDIRMTEEGYKLKPSKSFTKRK